MSDETKDKDEKIIQLFTGEDPNSWVDISYVKDEEQICSADDVLQAQIGQLKNVVLIGQCPSGGFMLASSLSRTADINLMVDAIKSEMTKVRMD